MSPISEEDEELGDRLRAAAAEGDASRDPEAEKWRADLAARLFGKPEQTVRIGRYEVLSRVGSGASGVVYAALDPQLDRKVALKVLRPDVALPTRRAEQWLAREAKILARLSHPNVVPVYDVGEDDGRLFIALELVEGRSLRPWMAQTHSWSEVVDVFVQAGRGLAAAHAAGLVHRDFKPENVLLGDDGRVRVSDFGVARRLAPTAEEVAQTDGGGPSPSASTSLTTHHGAGTPGYMAPEQFLGDPVDARTDQFGFCVALHEALYGERPFAGSTRAGLAANVMAGRRRPGSRRAGVPKWLDKVVARGLEVDPERRHPSMDALLAHLEGRRSGRGKKRWLVAGAFVAGLSGAVVLSLADSDEDGPCKGGEARLAAVWGPDKGEQVETAFSATSLPYADDSARRVREALDAYGRTWAQTHAQACEGVAEDAVMRRMYCLQSRLLELESLGDVFAQADRGVVEHAIASVGALVSPEECLFVGAAGPSPSEDDDDPTEATQLRMQIARAKALGDTGQLLEARRLAQDAAQRARDRVDRALEAEALVVGAQTERALLGVVEGNEAELTAYSAVLAAEAAHRPDLLARALVEYLEVTVYIGRHGQAWKWERRAREAVEVVGEPAELTGRIEYAMAMAESSSGRPDESMAAALRSLALFSEGGPATRRWVSTVENLLGELEFERGRYDEALPHYERARDIAAEEMGPEHAWVASAHGNMAEIFYLSGQYEEAAKHFEIALRIREDSYGPGSVWVIHTIAHLGDIALVQGRVEAALSHYRSALAARTELRRMAGDRPARDDETLAVYRDLQAWDQEQWLHHGIALSLLEQGQVEEAAQQLAKVREPIIPRDHHHPDLISRLDVHGQVELARGNSLRALHRFEQALDTMESELGADHRLMVHPLLGLARAHLEQGRPDRARPLLERALVIHGRVPDIEPRLRGDLHFALARATVGVPGRGAEARAMAVVARADYARAPGNLTARNEVLDSWLAEHGGAPDAKSVGP